MAIDRLPSGRFRARLMFDRQRNTATLPTEADARIWEIETRAAVAMRRRAASVTFAAYAAKWLAQFLDGEPDRARFEAALEHRLLPVLGALPLLEVLDADRDELHRSLADAGVGGDDDDAWECLGLILEDAADDLRAGVLGCRGAGTAGLASRLSEACVNRHADGTVHASLREVASVQDLCDSVAADVAAERLDRSPHELRRLLRAGQVCAHRRAGRWFVPVSEVRRLQRLPQPVGRPFSPGAAWALLAMLSGEEPVGLSAPRRSQLRRHVREGEADDLAARLGRRASRRLMYSHPSVLGALADDPRVVLTGLAAAEDAGTRLVAADNDDVEGYVGERDVAGLCSAYGLVDAETFANVSLHVVDDPAQVPHRSGIAAAPVVGLDLWESGDARASEEGRRLFVDALEAFRER